MSKPQRVLRSLPKLVRVLRGSRIPLRISHCITWRCNLNCRYCSRHGLTVDELSTDEVRGLMKGFADAGTLFWSFNGGEPLARTDIGELIAEGNARGMGISLATNGTLIAERIDGLRKVDVVTVTVDGPRDVQNAARDNSYDRMIAGLDALKANGIGTRFVTVMARHNLDSLSFVLDLARSYNAAVFFQPVRIQKEDADAKAQAFFPTHAEMRKALDLVMDRKKAGDPVASSIDYLETMRMSWPDRMPRVTCWAGKAYGFLTPDGYVTRCCDTLTDASNHPLCNTRLYGAEAFQHIPAPPCETCYSAGPMETNLLMSLAREHPIEAGRRFFKPSIHGAV